MGLVYWFLALIGIGTVLLWLPPSGATEGFTPLLTALFTATSAATNTGLVTQDASTYWSFFGQAVILGLIFTGGLGLLTGAGFLLLVAGQRIGLQNLLVLREGMGGELGSLRRLLISFVVVSIVLQLSGAAVLFVRFYVSDMLWPGISAPEAAWMAVFHSVSAFNNGGIDIFRNDLVGGDSVSGLRTDYILLGVLASLIVLGGFGYLVLHDIGSARRFNRLQLNTKVVLVGSVALVLGGAGVFLAQSWRDPGTLGPAGTGEKVAAALFDSIAARTAGYNAIDYSQAPGDRLVSAEMLMLVGGASASAAGGLKVNTTMVVALAVFAAVRGRRHVTAFKREIPDVTVLRAMVVVVTSFMLLGVFLLALTRVQGDLPFRAMLFELVSAFGTVGLSAGITPQLNTAAQLIIISVMFLGKFGPLTLMLFMVGREEPEKFRPAEEAVRIG